MTKISGKGSLALLMIMPVLLLVQLGLGLALYRTIKKTSQIETDNNKLDLYLRTNMKFISYSESAQRAYLLTGDKKYQESYNSDREEWKKNEAYYDTLPNEIKRNEVQDIREVSRKKLDETRLTIQLYNSNAKDSALNIVKSGYGKVLMDSVRAKTTFLRNQLNAEFEAARKGEYRLLYAFLAVIVILILLSLFITVLTYRAFNDYTQSLEKTVIEIADSNAGISRLNNQLKEANGYLEQLAFISAHDLKSPIHTLNGLVDIALQSKNLNGEDMEVMRLQKDVIVRMQQTNKGLNDILKVRNELLSKETSEAGATTLSEIFETVSATLRMDIENAGAQLRINLNNVGGVQFPFFYLQSVFYNLIANAVKFRHPERNLLINVEAKRVDKNTFQFIVADNGSGFDVERTKSKLFGIFKRFHPQIEGTGVGLHIVKSVVDAYGGEIVVTSEVGRGTTFEITLKNPILIDETPQITAG